MAMSLRRPAPRRTALSVVSMIDVMMILLFFFMITSSYLNLDMVPALQKAPSEDKGEDGAGTSGAPSAAAASPATLLIRITAEGKTQVAGKILTAPDLAALIAARIAGDPATPVLLFPSGGAELQALISVMDLVAQAGARRVKVIRIEAQP